jgi:hypothetical protein
MDKSGADEIAGAWIRDQGPAAGDGASHAMWQALAGLIPEPATCAWVSAEEADAPRLMAVAPGSLFLLDIEPRGEGASEGVRCRHIPIAPQDVSVSLLEHFETRTLRGMAQAYVRVRGWSFSLPNGAVLDFETVQAVQGGFTDDRQPGRLEKFARALAAEAGWAVPDEPAE